MVAPAESLRKAIQLHRAGELKQAEKIYQEILRSDPDNVQSLQLLAVVQLYQGEHARAVAGLKRAVALKPEAAETIIPSARLSKRVGS